ncbi:MULTISPECIES: hypothetical protein [Paraburkholderia]|uniref:hypothetical protein n=1 Tax=Paraburkholderia TaxID=1822464 RepID=UPI00036159E5|nr:MULTISPECIES: hypothetical protein [Paraburkholderia]MDH6148181.1 hypothetical protein [Paraburkholderia sp. WSM4179]
MAPPTKLDILVNEIGVGPQGSRIVNVASTCIGSRDRPACGASNGKIAQFAR